MRLKLHQRLFYVSLTAWLLLLTARGNAQTTAGSYTLAEALTILETRFDCSFLYETQLVRGQTVTATLLEDYAQLPALLAELEAQTSLTFTEVETNFWVVQTEHPYGQIYGYVYDKAGEPLVGASVYHPASERGAATDLMGRYELWVPAGELHLQTSYIGFQPNDTTLWLPFGRKLNLDVHLAKSVDLVEVLVLGNTPKSLSYLAPDNPAEQVKVAETTTLPIADLAQLLQYATPSFHATHQTLSDGTDHIDPATLRGLAPDQLVVLINGHRRHTSALVNVNNTIGRGSVATDLNAIPLSAIARVEILPDGATAQYGADAIAGVINIILKDETAPASVQVASGITAAGDGLQLGVTGHWGTHNDQRSWLLSWRVDSRTGVNRAGEYTGLIFGDSRDERADSVAAFFTQTGFRDRRVMEVGSATIRNFGLLLQHERKTKVGTLYQFGGANLRSGLSRGFYRFPYQKRKQSGLYHWGFSPEIRPTIADASWLVGWRGQAGPWQLDLSQNLGSNWVNFSIANSNNASMGLASPTTAEAGSLLYGQMISKADATRVSTDGRRAWHLGVQWRNEHFQQSDGDEWSWENYEPQPLAPDSREGGIQVFPGFRPTHRTRQWRSSLSAYALYNQHLTQRWRYSLAARSETWLETGTFLTGKLAVGHYWPSGLRIQAVLNSGLRPPSLGQLYFSSQNLQFISDGEKLVGAEIAHLNSAHPLIAGLIGQDLQPERSFNYSLRFHWPVREHSSFSFDAYRINIRDRIVLGSQLDGQDHAPLGDLLLNNELDKVQFFSNALRTQTLGVDVGYQQRWELRPKRTLNLRVVASFNRTRLVDIALPATLTGLETMVFNRQNQARLEHGQPNSKTILQLGWREHRWHFSLQATRFGQVQFQHPSDGDPANWVRNSLNDQVETRDQLFAAKWVTDLSVQWRARHGLTYSFQLRNAGNVYPDAHRHSANTSDGTFRYSRYVQQFGVWGRHFLLSCQWDF
ncbi:MAG: TonB-dependent receptor plug domain-containing protein [Bacteroidota bacterium]